jgi:TolB-like protein
MGSEPTQLQALLQNPTGPESANVRQFSFLNSLNAPATSHANDSLTDTCMKSLVKASGKKVASTTTSGQDYHPPQAVKRTVTYEGVGSEFDVDDEAL